MAGCLLNNGSVRNVVEMFREHRQQAVIEQRLDDVPTRFRCGDEPPLLIEHQIEPALLMVLPKPVHKAGVCIVTLGPYRARSANEAYCSHVGHGERYDEIPVKAASPCKATKSAACASLYDRTLSKLRLSAMTRSLH